MKSEALLSISAAILSLAVFPTAINAQSTPSADNNSAEHALSLRMVPAQTVFDKALEGKNAQAGQEFQVTLVQKVKLNDGQELPKGTVLAGTIVNYANAKLSVRITQAKLKDGKLIAIQAVITGLYDSGSLNAQYGTNSWTPGQVNVQQNSAVDGLRISSRVGTADSGTFEAKKENVKFDRGNALFLAIAPSEGSGTASATGK